jgi:CubicO group peptidase (beta-lactamase class C family)
MIRAAIAVVAVALPVGLVVARQSGPAPAPPSAAAAVIDGLRAELRADVAADNVGGITAAVVAGDRLVWAEGFGWADRDKHVPAGIETIYRIGSISKSFTAVVMCQLVDRKVIALDDPVERYLPEVRGFSKLVAGAKPITFRQLASHTGGLIREPVLPDAASGPIAEWEAKVLASIPKTSFDSTPGTKYSYSNIGYGVLGLALSRAASVPFMKLVEDGIFTPLGMTSSTYIIDDRLRPWLSVGYANSARGIDADLPAREHLGRGYKVPNGGIYSTVVDMARYIGALSGASKTVMSDTMRQALQTKQTPEPGPSGYGFGLQISATPGAATVVGHGGSVAGYVGQIAFDPRSKVGVIVLRNYNSGRTKPDVAERTVRGLAAAGQ